MEERLRLVARLLEGEAMSEVCREFGVSRKTGYKIFERYKDHGLEALSDRSRRPVRYANQLPRQIESLIVRCKQEKPHWAPARSASCCCAGSTATFACQPRARSMQFCAGMVSSNRSIRLVGTPPARRCRKGSRPMICGAPTSRASSSSAMGGTAILSPSPTTPRA